MGIEAGAKGGVSALKSHWIFFLLFAVAVVWAVKRYEKTNPGFLAGLPLIGRIFA